MTVTETVKTSLSDIVNIPKLMFYTSILWFLLGGGAGLYMVLSHLSGATYVANYYQAMTLHGVVMAFGGLFQLMMALSLMRAGFCYGKPVKGFVASASYLLLNLGLLMAVVATWLGVRTSYTLMFPLPAVGALHGLWTLDAVTLFVWGVVLVVAVVVALYPSALARLIFFGKTREALILERFVGTLNPSGMASMLPYIFIVPVLGSAILLEAALIGMALINLVPLDEIAWILHPLNFNYPFWVWAHNLMEAMGIMGLGTVYWLIPRYTARMERAEDAAPRLYSEKLGIFAIIFYASAAVMAFPHHLYTMPTSQPIGLSYTGQIASWLTGFGAAFSVFNISATAYRKGLRLTPATLAAMLGFTIYVVDGFIAMQLGTIGWAYRLHGTYYATAHLMTILLAVTLIWIGAAYHSHSLLTGRTPSNRLAYTHILLTALGALGIFYIMAYMGAEGFPRRTYPLPFYSDPPMAGILVFGLLLAIGQAAFLLNLIKAKSK
ncbi:Alternative cytochrome c oxidase subunit 1 [Candidatus Calditenuaceae archaeon HR02]|nr:Alternative cytochrome c oxidase subunit 1 [Candidatus Calditenuaceae archaeon HR02]